MIEHMFVQLVSNVPEDGLDEWPEPHLRAVIADWERCRAQGDGIQARALAALVRRGRVPETMFGSKMSVRQATRRTNTAVALTDGSLPGAAEALAAGTVTFEHVATLAAAKDDLPEGAAVNLLAQATVMPPDKFARAVSRSCPPVEAPAEAKTGTTTKGRRWFSFDYDHNDGTVVFNTLEDVMDEQWRAAHPERAKAKLDAPPYGQRLAQALVELCRRNNRNGSVPEGGSTPTVADLGILLFYDQMVADADAVGIATTIDGHLIPAGVLRKLLVDAKVYPIVLGGDGEVLDLGRGRRLFTAAQKKAMAIRDGTCQFADCDKPARYTDAHHTVPWANGGLTNLADGAIACGEDHDKLTKGGYRLERRNGTIYTYAPDGTLIHTRTNRWRK